MCVLFRFKFLLLLSLFYLSSIKYAFSSKGLECIKQWRYFREIYCTFKFIFFNYTSQNMVLSFHEIKLPQKLKYGI